jgi:hypothetical protein
MRVLWQEALTSLWRFLPWLFVPLGVDILWVLIFDAPLWNAYLAPAQLPLALVTLGILPHPLASVGVWVSCLGVSFFSGWIIWKTSQGWKRALGYGVAMLASFFVLLLVPSILGWIGRDASAAFLSMGPNGVERGLIHFVNQGYWWHNAFDRFLGARGGEVETSISFFLLALAYLGLVVAGTTWFARSLRLSWRAWLALLKPRACALYGIATLFGACLGIAYSPEVFRFGWVNIIAFFVLLVTWTSAWIFMILRQDAFDLAEDEQSGVSNCFVHGSMNPRFAEDVRPLLLGATFLGAWILGWPILTCFIVFLIGQELLHHPSWRWKQSFPINIVLLGFLPVSLFTAGWFFGTQGASLSPLGLGFFVGLAMFFAFFTTIRDQKTLLTLVKSEWRVPAMAILVAAGYILLPLWSHLWVWMWIAGPFGLASAFFLWHNPPHLRAAWRLFFLFFPLSFFILAAVGRGS